MRLIYILLAVTMLFICSACGYGPITGTVVDSETGRPIDGAVVMVEWTKTHGFGNTYTESFKVIEKLTDKEGKFNIEGLSDSSVNPPDMTIYKKGYVAWSSWLIFPSHKRKENFKWKDGYVYKLERFDGKKYTYEEHTFFIHSATHSSMGNKKMISEAYRWEELSASRELDEKWRKEKGPAQ